MTTLNESVRQFILKQKKIERIVVACSGGLDSMVLLNAVVQAEIPLPIVAVHVNHQLSANALAWQAHCERVFKSLSLRYHLLSVEVINNGDGLEQAARLARYRAIQSKMYEGDLLLTGHHADDQAETILLKLSRGAGVRGIAGISSLKKLPPGLMGRPLLSFDRETLLNYANAHQLEWVEDESNTNQEFDRNFIRHSVLPTLKERWPQFSYAANRCAQRMTDAEQLLIEYGQEDLKLLNPRRERLGVSLELDTLMAYSAQRRNNILRVWLQSLDVSSPDVQQFNEFEKFVLCDAERSPQLIWGPIQLRRFKNRLYCLPHKIINALGAYSLPSQIDLNSKAQAHSFPDGSVLVCREPKVEAETMHIPSGQYQIKTRADLSADFKAKPKGRRHSQSFKKLLLEYGVEPWLRSAVPLLFKDNNLIAVVGYWLEDGVEIDAGDSTVELDWFFP